MEEVSCYLINRKVRGLKYIIVLGSVITKFRDSFSGHCVISLYTGTHVVGLFEAIIVRHNFYEKSDSTY